MADVMNLQGEQPDAPDEEKVSNVSYYACRNSYVSERFCWKW